MSSVGFQKDLQKNIKPSNVLYVSSTYDEDDTHFNTITKVLDNATDGTAIILGNEYFDEDVVIDIPQISLIGYNKEQTSIKSLTINAIDTIIKDLQVVGNFELLITTDNWRWFAHQNIFENVRFSGDVNIGTETHENRNSFLMKYCVFDKPQQNIRVHSYASIMDRCIIENSQSDDGSGGTNNATLTLGGITDTQDTMLTIKESYLLLKNLIFDNREISPSLRLEKTFMSLNNTYLLDKATTTNYGILGAWWSDVQWNPFPTVTQSNIKIEGKFEFGLFYSRFFMPNIEFDSIAVSRWDYVEQIGWGSTSTITGSGLNKLYIRHSVFHCSAPSGLAEDQYNAWNSMIDM